MENSKLPYFKNQAISSSAWWCTSLDTSVQDSKVDLNQIKTY